MDPFKEPLEIPLKVPLNPLEFQSFHKTVSRGPRCSAEVEKYHEPDWLGFYKGSFKGYYKGFSFYKGFGGVDVGTWLRNFGSLLGFFIWILLFCGYRIQEEFHKLSGS